MKRFWLGLLAFLMVCVPVLASAEAATQAPAESFEDAGDIDAPEEWALPDDGGLSWDAAGLTIALPEDAASGFLWTAELDDETVLSLASDSASAPTDGTLPVHTFAYQPAADGAAVVSLYYEQAESENIAAMLSYAVTVEGGQIIDAEYEDLSGWGGEGDDEGGVLYEGETGGVPLYVPEGMKAVSDQDGVTKLSSEDGLTWMTIEYDPDGDPDELLSEFEDAAAMEKAYTDPDTGTSFISTATDRESDPPRGILVYETNADGKDTIIEYTGYQAPNGGVLMVYTGYLVQ